MSLGLWPPLRFCILHCGHPPLCLPSLSVSQKETSLNLGDTQITQDHSSQDTSSKQVTFRHRKHMHLGAILHPATLASAFFLIARLLGAHSRLAHGQGPP